MKRTVLTIAATLAFGLCALAQQKPSNDPRTAPPGADPNTMPTPQQTPDTASSPQTSASDSKGDKKLKGCLRSQGGSIVLEEKKGKQVALAGSGKIFSPLTLGTPSPVHGSYAGAAGAPGTATSTAGAGDQFTVSRIDLVSETCSADKAKDKTAQPQ